MIKEARLLTTTLFAALTAHANVIASADAFTRLEHAVCGEAANPPQSANQAEALAQLKCAVEKEDLDRALFLLQKIAGANQTFAVQELCCEVQSQIFTKKRALAETLVAKNAELLRKTGEACLKANCKGDLEPLKRELDERRDALTRIDCAMTREAAARLENALKFVQLWSKYLETRTTDLTEAKAQLIYLANIDISHLMIERSRLRAKIEQIPDPENLQPPPAAPSNLVNLRNDDGSSELSWTNNDESANGVVINKQTLEGTWLTLEELPPNVTTFHVPNPCTQFSQ
ncbi:MAG: hypothetical protein QOI96_1323 [Verrucomicrobiota bacterium]